MRTVPCCFTIFLVTGSPTTPVIYSLKFLVVFNFLTINFLAFSTGHRCENQPVLSLGGRLLDAGVA